MKVSIDKFSKVPVYLQIADQIKSQIISGAQLPQQFQLFLFGECGFKFFKSFRVLLTDQNPPAYEKSPPYIPMVRPPDNHDEAAQVLDRGIVPASAFCENWQRMFLSSNAQTAPCCNHESVQSGSADRSVMGSGTNVQLLGVQKRIPVIDSSGLPDLACLCFFQAATFPAARLTDYRNTKPLFVKPRSQKQKISKPVALVLLVLRFFILCIFYFSPVTG